jgi:hypothetical protein
MGCCTSFIISSVTTYLIGNGDGELIPAGVITGSDW